MLLIIALAALALPGSAAAADYRGKTSQGLRASAFVKDGRLKLLKINWAAPCDHGPRWKARTRWEDKPEGPIEHDGSKFTDSGSHEQVFPDGRVTFTQKLAGQFSDRRISGKMTVRMKLYTPEGEHVNNCRGTFRFNIPKV